MSKSTLAIILVCVCIFIGGPIFWFATSPLRSIGGVVSKTISSENILANYQWFYDQKNEIDATRNKVKIARRNNLPETAGIEMVLQGMIGEYNSRSKQINRKLWKANDLPYQISTEDE